jgi:type IV secretory pathway VirB2 component (pilin)
MVTATQKALEQAEARLDAALEALAEQHAPGPLSKRIESATDEVQDEALTALAEVLGGNMARSKAIRAAITRGLMAMRDERAKRV